MFEIKDTLKKLSVSLIFFSHNFTQEFKREGIG